MENKKKKLNWKMLVSLVVVVILLVCLLKLIQLTNDISNLRNQIDYMQADCSDIQNQISSIYNNVDELLKKEASLVSFVDYTVGEVDYTTHRAKVLLKVVPKNVADDMQLSVNIGDETTDFTRTGNEFTASLQVGIFLTYGSHPMLNIKTSDEIKTELLDSVDFSSLYRRNLPNISADFWGHDTYSNGSIKIDGNVSVYCENIMIDNKISIAKLELITERNGKVIERKDITSKLEDEYCEFSIEEKYKVKSGDELVMYVEAEDIAGYIHKSQKYFWFGNDEVTGHGVTENISGGIFDKEGKLLTID